MPLCPSHTPCLLIRPARPLRRLLVRHAVLRFIEWRWDLEPLAERDAKANNLLNAFDFAQKP